MQTERSAMNDPSASVRGDLAVRILVADDHQVVRRGICTILRSRADWHVVAEAADGGQALELAEATQPEVAIVDYSLPVMNGSHLTRRIREVSPQTEVLIFTMHDSEVLICDALKAGAKGFLLKSDAEYQLIHAVDALARHRTYFTDRIDQALLDRYLSTPGELASLTTREREVVQLVAEGHSCKSIGRILDVSPKTVETHRASAMHKLAVGTTAALVRYAVRNKLIEP